MNLVYTYRIVTQRDGNQGYYIANREYDMIVYRLMQTLYKIDVMDAPNERD